MLTLQQMFFPCLCAFLAGAAVTSFAQVVAFRAPKGLDFVRGRSACPKCAATLPAIDLIPVFSYLLLGGRCRRCKAKIPVSHLVFEAVGGGACILAIAVFGLSLRAAAAAAMLLALLAASIYDMQTMEIPNAHLAVLAVPCLALAALGGDLPSSALGFVLFPLPLLACALAVQDSFGGGDIKLAALCGLALGWKAALVGLFFSLVLGGGFAMMGLLTRKIRRGQHFAFGPFLSLGAGAALLWGAEAARWYGSFILP